MTKGYQSDAVAGARLSYVRARTELSIEHSYH
jgi:hypothetical protein